MTFYVESMSHLSSLLLERDVLKNVVMVVSLPFISESI